MTNKKEEGPRGFSRIFEQIADGEAHIEASRERDRFASVRVYLN